MEEFEYEEVVKATENFNPRRVVGKGSHGMVYKGVVRFKENNSFRLVAVKKPSQGLQSLHDNSKLENEIRVLSSLPENPHVVNLLGTTGGDGHGHRLIVMDFMPNASLHDLLHANENPPTWPKRVQIAMQIARAVQFLHQGKPVVIHRDIKPSNILFDSRWNAKLADFGLAVRGVDPVSRPAGTMGYLDPCYTTPDKLSTKNDIFSFGVVLLEIISGRKAIDACKTPASVVEWAVRLMDEQVLKEIYDARVTLPGYMVETITRLLRYASRCVSENEDERPSAGEIVMGMESWLANGVRFPVWRRVLNGLVWLRKRKPMMSIGWQTQTRIQCIAEEEGEEEGVGVPGGKISITIREVLADVNVGVTQIQMS